MPRDADLDDVNQRLNEGLESCRSMIASYRGLLAPQPEVPNMPDASDHVEGKPAD